MLNIYYILNIESTMSFKLLHSITLNIVQKPFYVQNMFYSVNGELELKK